MSLGTAWSAILAYRAMALDPQNGELARFSIRSDLSDLLWTEFLLGVGDRQASARATYLWLSEMDGVAHHRGRCLGEWFTEEVLSWTT